VIWIALATTELELAWDLTLPTLVQAFLGLPMPVAFTLVTLPAALATDLRTFPDQLTPQAFTRAPELALALTLVV
jgi:hypothetical protein